MRFGANEFETHPWSARSRKYGGAASDGNRWALSRWQLLWPIAIAGLVILASARSRVAGPSIEHLDKVVHFSVYGLLATLLGRLGQGWRWAGGALAIVSAFGATDEWHQSFVPGRETEFADWVADTGGAAVALGMYFGWAWYRRLLETPLRLPGKAQPNPGSASSPVRADPGLD